MTVDIEKKIFNIEYDMGVLESNLEILGDIRFRILESKVGVLEAELLKQIEMISDLQKRVK